MRTFLKVANFVSWVAAVGVFFIFGLARSQHEGVSPWLFFVLVVSGAIIVLRGRSERNKRVCAGCKRVVLFAQGRTCPVCHGWLRPYPFPPYCKRCCMHLGIDTPTPCQYDGRTFESHLLDVNEWDDLALFRELEGPK